MPVSRGHDWDKEDFRYGNYQELAVVYFIDIAYPGGFMKSLGGQNFNKLAQPNALISSVWLNHLILLFQMNRSSAQT